MQRLSPIHTREGDTLIVTLRGVAEVRLRAGAVAAIAPADGADPADVAWLVDGHAREVAALQRGELALRAAAVVIDGRAVAICATAASGASALAAGLAAHGHGVIADGWLPVRVRDGAPEAVAVTDALALWPDMATLVQRDPEAGVPVRPGLRKRRHRFAPGADAPLAAVVILRRMAVPGDDEPDAGGASAFTRVMNAVALEPLGDALGLQAERFRWGAAISSGCTVRVLLRDPRAAELAGLARVVEELVRG